MRFSQFSPQLGRSQVAGLMQSGGPGDAELARLVPPELGPATAATATMVEFILSGWPTGRSAVHPGDRFQWDQDLRSRGWHLADWPGSRGGPGWTLQERWQWHWMRGFCQCPEIAPLARQLIGPALIRAVGSRAPAAGLLGGIAENRLRLALALGDASSGLSAGPAGTAGTAGTVKAIGGDGDDWLVTGSTIAVADREPQGAPGQLLVPVARPDGRRALVLVDDRQPGVRVVAGNTGTDPWGVVDVHLDGVPAVALGISGTAVQEFLEGAVLDYAPVGALAQCAQLRADLKDRFAAAPAGDGVRRRLDQLELDQQGLLALLGRGVGGDLPQQVVLGRLGQRLEAIGWEVAALARECDGVCWIAQPDPILAHNVPVQVPRSLTGVTALAGIDAGTSVLVSLASAIRGLASGDDLLSAAPVAPGR